MYQSTIIVGNVGKDPEMRYTPQGKAVAEFSVAVNRKRGAETETTWFRVTCWEKLADTVNKYLKKGRQVMVIGDQLKASAWVGQDGEARATLELTARDVRFLGGADGEARETEQEDLPF